MHKASFQFTPSCQGVQKGQSAPRPHEGQGFTVFQGHHNLKRYLMDFQWLLNPDLSNPWLALLLVVVSFLGSAMTAAFSLGGGLILIALMGAILPANVVVPVHGAIMLGSNGGRSVALAPSIDWSVVLWFTAGAIIGGALGGQIALTLPAHYLRLAIGGFVLYSQWGRGLGRVHFDYKRLVAIGGFSSFLTMFVGATGPFITSILSQRKNMNRMQMIGTAGACMVSQHGIKVALFALAGFAYAPWAPLIITCIIAGFAGTLLGTRTLKRFDEKKFRKILKWILTALGIYLIFIAVQGFF